MRSFHSRDLCCGLPGHPGRKSHGVRWIALLGLTSALVSCAVRDTASPQRSSQSLPTPTASSAEAELRALLGGMGVQLIPEEKRLEISGWVNMQKGLIEVFACAPEGKTHESLLVLDCIPSGIHAGLLALGLSHGTPVETGTEADYKPPTGDPVLVEVVWKTPQGEDRRVRAEDMIWDQGKKAPLSHISWLFTGSFSQSVTGNPEDASYAADFVKSIITTYHDPSSVLENPLPDGRDDTLYYVREDLTPPVGTPVRLILTRG